MAFPVNIKDPLWERNWPSPIVFHESNPGRPIKQVRDCRRRRRKN
jgi:hypothetical protein